MKLTVYFFILFSVFIHTDTKAQKDRNAYAIRYSVDFKESKFNLTDEGKTIIDTICQMILTAGIDSFFAKKELVLQSYTTAKESKKNHLIALMRCEAILDYIENKYKISRVKFLIRVRIPSPNSKSEVVFAFFRKLQ